MNLGRRRRRIVGAALLALGLATMTYATVGLRDTQTPAFQDGNVARDAAGHTKRQLIVSGVGVALALAGGILLP